MKKSLFIFCLFLFSQLMLIAQNPESITRDGLKTLLNKGAESNDLYIYNFWATWCAPCVKEIGYFEKIKREYTEQGVHVILINLDFNDHVQDRVIPFLRKHEITATVYHMQDMDYNSWIPLVDRSWSGAIPATLIRKNDEKVFFEKELNQDELNKLVNNYLK